jgi:hypothetical protein
MFCAWRAATQSMAHDEAFAYFRYLNRPWPELWSPFFDANHHVLYTGLAKLSVTMFGSGEFAQRIPSVLAGFAMMLGIFAILQDCQRAWVRWAAFIALGLHPLLLDFSVAARGYGMGLAFLAWAIYAIQKDRPAPAGILLGLSIAANLSMAIPAAAVMVAARQWRSAAQTALITASVAAAICLYPMRGATATHFYVGLERWDESLKDLVYTATRVVSRGPGLFGTEEWAAWIARWVLPVQLAICLVLGWRRRPVVVLSFALLGIIALHTLLGLKYPIDRTGLYVPLLAAWAWASMTDRAPRPAMISQMVIAALCIAQFATQIQWTTFRVWPFNASAREVALRLREECAGKAPGSVRAHMFFPDHPSMEYYREHYAIACVQPFERSGELFVPGYDYYVANRPVPGGTVLYQGSGMAVSLIRAGPSAAPVK